MSDLNWFQVKSVLHREDVFIIGGGPSLGSFDWDKLRGRNVIACNAAMFLLPRGIARWGTFGDSEFLSKFRSEIREFASNGSQVLYFSGRLPKSKNHWISHVRRLPGRRNWGISLFPENGVAWNRSTGAASVNLAYLMGAGRIILLGFDMKVSLDGDHNWHNMYKGKLLIPEASHYQDHLINPFREITKDLNGLGIPIYQTNPSSSLDFISYRPIEEFL